MGGRRPDTTNRPEDTETVPVWGGSGRHLLPNLAGPRSGGPRACV